MVKAIVFFDLDGTLLQPDKSVTPEIRAAIAELRANDVVPAVASGRNVFEIQYVLDETGIDTIVAANGSFVQYQGQPVAQVALPKALVADFNGFAAARQAPVGWYNQQGFALSAANADTATNYALLHLDAQVVPDWAVSHPVNFMFAFDRGHDAEWQQAFAGKLSLVRNNPLGLDVMQAGVSKQTGIRTLMQVPALVDAATYGFGDAANDLPMLAEVAHPVAMGNATPAVKAAAEFVTTANTKHGILNGLRRYHLL